jgi:phosphoribosylanthranilate isomerase
MTLIKICGITNLTDALMAVSAGADALGFNFYRPSPRYIDPARAREIIDQLPEKVIKVGVFVNEESLTSIAEESGIDALQLHGDESPEFCSSLDGWFVIKTLPVDDQFDSNKWLDYQVDAIMLDAKHSTLRGGTGQVIDWSLAQTVQQMGARLVLAGGLSPDNVGQAIRAVKPYAVDACSALESSPGKKDEQKVRAFIEAIRASRNL